jgi:hypothetical protein
MGLALGTGCAIRCPWLGFRHPQRLGVRVRTGQAVMPIGVIYACAAMLFIGAAPLCYGYYTLLRLVACGVFGFAAFITADRKHNVLPWVFGLMALLFNPIVKVHLPKEAWALVDVAADVFLLVAAKAVRTNA